MTVLIGTPAYGQMIHIAYLNSVMEFKTEGIPINILTLGNESLITRARNAVISYFYHHRENFSHLLFLDADIGLPAAGLKHMLELDRDVVGAAVPLKGRTADNQPIFNVSTLEPTDQKNIYTTDKVGTAVLLLSRKAVTSLIEKAQQENRIYHNSKNWVLGQDWDSVPMFDVFQVGVHNGEYLPEDYWVCKVLSELGYSIYIDGTVPVIHHGNQAFHPT